MERGGRPVPRPLGTVTPCGYCPKQPPTVPPAARTPDTAEELSERNWVAYQHYLECRAVGVFPDDPLARRNAAVIAQAERAAEQLRAVQTALLASRR